MAVTQTLVASRPAHPPAIKAATKHAGRLWDRSLAVTVYVLRRFRLLLYDYLWKDGIILSTFHGTRVYHAISLYGLFG